MAALKSLGFISNCLLKNPAHTVLSVRRMDCTAYLLLTFVWDKTAAGTARNKTSVLLLAVPVAVSSHTTARSRPASTLFMLLTVPEAEFLKVTVSWSCDRANFF